MVKKIKKPKVKLIGQDSNAFMIIGLCSRALKEAGRESEVETFRKEAMSGDYDNVLATAAKWCEIH